MISYIRTDSSHPEFVRLVQRLDKYLASTDGDEHDFYHQFNSIKELKQVILGSQNGKAIACGSIKSYDEAAMEVKRMYVDPTARNQGIASGLLASLETWALELGFEKCVLETGKRQFEAVQFYQKCGYSSIANYGQYAGMENSLCFEKVLK